MIPNVTCHICGCTYITLMLLYKCTLILLICIFALYIFAPFLLCNFPTLAAQSFPLRSTQLHRVLYGCSGIDVLLLHLRVGVKLELLLLACQFTPSLINYLLDSCFPHVKSCILVFLVTTYSAIMLQQTIY